jgi:hypothetical protein
MDLDLFLSRRRIAHGARLAEPPAAGNPLESANCAPGCRLGQLRARSGSPPGRSWLACRALPNRAAPGGRTAADGYNPAHE